MHSAVKYNAYSSLLVVWQVHTGIVCSGAEADRQMGYMECWYDVKTHVWTGFNLMKLELDGSIWQK